MQDALQVLQSRFGFSSFRGGQEAVIASLLAGRSAAAVFPTGSGKSLCYQLPALMLPGLTIVVSPLIALMKDQDDKLKASGIQSARLDSSLTPEETSALMASMRAGSLTLLFVAPERFNNERFREALKGVRISLMAIDEAHCISEWGHNFRPDYLKLVSYAREFAVERFLALTATATKAVLQDICRAFSIDERDAVRTGVYRPNLTVLTTPTATERVDDLLIARLKEAERGPTIVYATQQKTTERLAALLDANGVRAKAYHAGMKAEERAAVQDWFLTSPDATVVATIAFGMGIDKPDIRNVFHYNLPKSLENFAQEIGRAGRDGLAARCEVFARRDDLAILENFARGDIPEEAAVDAFVRHVFEGGEVFEIATTSAADRFDVKAIVLQTLLVYLELDGYLRGGTPVYTRFSFRLLKPLAEILGGFDPARRSFLESVINAASFARIWYRIDVEQASQSIAEPRERIVRALGYLDEQGFIELKAEGIKSVYRVVRRPRDTTALKDELFDRLVHRERSELARLAEVVELVTLDACQVSALSAYFDEPLPSPCGHCTWCLNGQRPVELPEAAPRPLPADELSAARRFVASHPELKDSKRTLTKFFCGISTPRFTAKRLMRHELFGVWSEHDWDQVAAAVDEL